MENFDQILNKYNWPRRRAQSKVTIDEIENFIKFKLPADYKSYVENYLGFELLIGPEFLRLWDIDELIENNKAYGITDELTNLLGIGSNGSGEFIGIEKIDNANMRVVLSSFIDLSKDNNIEIGSSFTDFFISLDNGKPWFIEKQNV